MKQIFFATLFSLFSVCFSFAEQITLFNSSGVATAYIDTDDGLTIYLWNGTPVAYLVTNGVVANQANGFVAASSIGAYSDIVIDVVDVASGGATRETVDSIKYSAAAQYATQNRLVTTSDYESYIKSKYPSIDSLSVWGGEDETPKVFGKVYIALKPKTNSNQFAFKLLKSILLFTKFWFQ